MVGWIKINDTVINYPVMQTKKIPDYYLNHDFYKNESVYGCPYVQANCDVDAPSDKSQCLCGFLNAVIEG